MSLILKQEAANAIPTPPLGKGTLFLNTTDQLVVKNSAGNISTALTLTSTGNTDVIYNNAGEVGLSSNMTFNNTTNTFAVTNANVGNLTVTGTLTAGNIAVSKIANGTSNVDIVSASGNVTIGVAGNANVLTVTGSSVIVSGNANVGNLNTAQVLASANITTPQFISNVTTGTAPIVVTSTTQVANLNAATAGLATFAATANAVALANVSGAGNIAALNTDGNASNILYGNGVFASASAGGSYGNSNVATFLASYGSNTISTTGNITAGNIIGNGQALTGIAGANVSGQVANALVAGTVYTNAQPNITSVGTLTGLTVSGNILPSANVTYDLGSPTQKFKDLYLSGNSIILGAQTLSANASGVDLTGTLSGDAGGLSNIAGANVSGQVANALVAGTVYTNAQPNITSVGTLSSLAVTGNISGGNLTTGGLVNATGNIQSNANVVTDLIVGRTSSISITATGTNQNINLTPTGTGTVNVGNFIISNVATPLTSTDAATKQYVDDVAQGLHTHDSCNAATQTTLASISGGTVTYNNGASGVGATLTTTGTYTTIDGVTLSNGMRILVKDEVTTANNGIYVRTSATVLTRADDFDTPTEMAGGDFTFVTAGTLYDNTGWVMTDPVTTVGTSPVIWVQFSGAGTYTAGTGLTLTGSQFSITNTTVTAGSYGNGDSVASFTVNGQGQLSAAANVAITANAANLTGTTLASGITTSSLTTVGTLGSLSVTGNISAGNVSATTFTGALSGAATTAGTVTTNAQPNITSTGTLTSLAVTGNISAGNVSATTFTGALSGAATTAGTVTTNAQSNITSIGTLTSLDVSGTITAANITANTGVFTGNGNGLSSLVGANVTGNVSNALNAYAVAVANVSGIGNIATVNLDGNLSNILYGNGVFASAPAGGSYGNSNVATFLASYGSNTISTTGNVTAGNIIGNGQALSGIAGANVTGTVANATYATSAGSANSVAVANVSGIGNIATVNLDGNLSNILYGNGVFAPAAGGGSYDNSNVATFLASFGSNSISTTGNVTVGNIIGNGQALTDVAGANISGQVANALIAGTVYTNAQPNITSIGTLTSLDVTGNISAGNVNAGNLLTANYSTAVLTTAAQPNITSVGTLTSLAVTGNATSDNFIGRLANGNSNVNIAAANGNVTIAAVGNTTLTITGTGANIFGYANVSGNVTAAYYSGNGSPLTGVVATVRTVTVTDATSITMNADTSDVVVQTNTQAVGTLTINAVSGTPINGQKIILRLQSANVQTFAWNAVFAGSTDTPLPTVSSGSNKYDYMGFIYNSLATNWQMMAKNFGF